MSKIIIFIPFVLRLLTVILSIVFVENKPNLKIITIYINDTNEWKAVEDLRNRFEIRVLSTDSLITALIDENKEELFIKALNHKNIKYVSINSSVVLENMSKMKRKSSKVKAFDYENSYHNLEEIYTELDRIKTTKTDVSKEVFSIGKSYENRDIKAIKILTQTPKDVKEMIAVIECGVHSNEWLPIAFCMYAINKLLNFGNEEPFTHFNFIIIPVLNPDGWKIWKSTEDYNWMRGMSPEDEERFFNTRLHRKNMQITSPQEWNANYSCNPGTDLNRNFDTHKWCDGKASKSPCNPMAYCGTEPFSAPETRALRDYLLPLKDKIFLYFGIHSYQGMWTYPWAFTTDPTPDSDLLSEWSRRAVQAMNEAYGRQYTFGQIGVELYVAGGTSQDWAYHTLEAYAFVFEMWPIQQDNGSHHSGFLGFHVPENEIKQGCDEAFIGLNVTLALSWTADKVNRSSKFYIRNYISDRDNSALSNQYMSRLIITLIVFIFAIF